MSKRPHAAHPAALPACGGCFPFFPEIPHFFAWLRNFPSWAFLLLVCLCRVDYPSSQLAGPAKAERLVQKAGLEQSFHLPFPAQSVLS
jgi:hypothetical protein